MSSLGFLTLLLSAVLAIPSFAAPKAPTTKPANPKPKTIDKLPNTSPKDEVLKYYSIEDIPTPPGVAGEVGGMAFMPDGRLAVCFHAGDVWTYTPENRKWDKFAEGMHEPLGLVAINDDEVVVMQRPELTRISDANTDGVADTYTTLTDQFGMTGNYHEFAFGPAVDKAGSFYVALNCASNGAGVRHEIRGEYRADGRDGRMYAAVPYRGWVLRVSPDGKKTTPFALGFRSPNGIGFDLEGNLWVSDNQGDWLGTSTLYHVREGRFYGHAASLTWKDGFIGSPIKMAVKELDKMRTKPAVQFPHGIMANSPTQPLPDSTKGKFGPYAGQLFVGEMNQPRIMRIMLDKVNGEFQGACVPLFDKSNLKAGVNRMAFAPDGSLWVGHDSRDRAWTGGKGLQRIKYLGKTPMDVQSMKLTPTGFDLTFTRPLDVAVGAEVKNYQIRRYYYEYHQAYGSPQYDMADVTVKSATLSADRKTVSLALDHLREGYVFEMHFPKIAADDGSPTVNPFVCYTLNHVVEGTNPQMLKAGAKPSTRPAAKPEVEAAE